MTMKRGSKMERRRVIRIVIVAFVIGAAAPFVISVFTMLVSFNTGVSVATAILMADSWPDPLIPLANGLLYSCLTWAVTSLLRFRNR
jgi:hypothetical protein